MIGAIAALIGYSLRSRTAALERLRGSQLVGLRVFTVGLCIAVAGWLAGVFLSKNIGVLIVVLGFAGGLVGLAIHASRLVGK